MRLSCRSSVAFVVATLVFTHAAIGQSATRWVATWGASQFAGQPRPPADSVDRTMTVVGRTIREIVHVSVGGDRVRVRLTNLAGDRPLFIGSAHVALRTSGSSIAPATDHAITFNGHGTVFIRAGAYMISDEVTLAVPQLSDIAVSLFLSDSARLSTRHALGIQTNYLSATGDFTGATTFTPDTTIRFWPYVAGVDVVNSSATGVIVAFGNSITDGLGSTLDSNTRWPDVLARRLLGSKEPPKAVINEGISGNRVLSRGRVRARLSASTATSSCNPASVT
jgi:hypothetical protein